MPRKEINEYLAALEELRKVSRGREDISLNIGGNKYFCRMCTEKIALLFIADIGENDRVVNEKIDSAAKAIAELLERHPVTHIKKRYANIMAPFVRSKLKIALVGEGGVGKTTTLHLLMGEQPPTQYIPTVALDMQVIENIHFANYSLVIWDFAGQERFRKLWKLYFKGADIVFLLTDSTLRNVILSKDMFTMIRRDAANIPIVVIANKQDLPNALDPSIIEKIIGAETHPLVAIDLAYRDDFMRILLNTAAKHVNVQIPDIPVDELLKFEGDELLEAA
ncbi:MAG: GTP-binding protein [Candidatus Thorarchaeota archaeon]|nr:MAG: GTP-binding protein [Candidatus Thorarchaeota archaeon]